jgi:nucleoside-diphosphate-sugar epimerase
VEPTIIFNLGNTHEVTILELAEVIHELCGPDGKPNIKMVPYKDLGGNYEDVLRRTPDITRARTLLGFEPKVDLREGLLPTIKWQREAMGLMAELSI